MKISYKGDYALKTILDLAFFHGERLVHLDELSQRQDIPKKFLVQIISQLKYGGYITSYKGPQGGYTLAKSPDEITMGEIIRYMEGPISPITCVSKVQQQECDFKEKCGFYDIFEKIRDMVADVVDNITFKDLKEKLEKKKKEQIIDYQI